MDDMKETGFCAICEGRYTYMGNNPAPLLDVEERVCDQCNSMFVIPARMGTPMDVERARMIATALKPYNVQMLISLWQTLLWKPTPEQMEALKVVPSE